MVRALPRFLFIAACLPAACAPAPDGDVPADDGAGEPVRAEAEARGRESWRVDFRSYGPIPLGASLADADRAAGGLIEPPAADEGCHYTRIDGAPEGVLLMVVDGRVARVDVRRPGVATRAGVGVGDAAAGVRAGYPGPIEERPHKYTDGRYLIVSPSEGDGHRLVFEIEADTVRQYRAGTLPEVEWVEGCS